jgi:hypothetical protein
MSTAAAITHEIDPPRADNDICRRLERVEKTLYVRSFAVFILSVSVVVNSFHIVFAVSNKQNLKKNSRDEF